MAYTWRRAYGGSQRSTPDQDEWDEVWNVYGYSAGPGALAIYDLTADRPDLKKGQPHPTVAGAYVDEFEPVRHGNTKGWQARVHYKTEPAVQLDQYPWDRPAEISVETEIIQVPTFKRADGTAILNTAGGLIYGVTRPIVRLIFQVEKNVQSIPSWVLAYSDLAVNNDEITVKGLTLPAGKVQLQKVRAPVTQYATVNGVTVPYEVLNFALAYDPRGWETKAYNRGLMCKKDDGTIDYCVTDAKEPVTEPQFLDADGKQIPLPVSPASIIEVDASNITPLPFNGTLPLV